MANIKIFASDKNFFVPRGFNNHNRETPSVHRTMEKHNFRPCGLRNCYRSKHSFSLCSSSNVSTSDKNTSGVISNFRAGSSKPASKGSNMRGSLYTRRFLQSAVLSSKKGRKYEASRRFEPSKSFYRNSTLSDGASDNSSVSAQTGALYDEIGSEGCVPVSGYTPRESKVSSIFVAEESIPVPSSAIRPQYRTIGVHSLDETSCKFPKETGYTPSPVFRRYAHHRIDPSGDPSVHPDGNGSPRVVGARDKQGEVDTNPLSVNYIPGVYDQFDENALHAPSRESVEITDAMSSDSLRLGSTASNLSPVIGTARVLPPSGLESTSSFSSLKSPPNQGSGRIESQLHNTGPINSSSQRGTDLVAPELSQSQWQPDYSSHARPHNFHRRLLNRLGGCLWQQSDQREMVSHVQRNGYI